MWMWSRHNLKDNLNDQFIMPNNPVSIFTKSAFRYLSWFRIFFFSAFLCIKRERMIETVKYDATNAWRNSTTVNPNNAHEDERLPFYTFKKKNEIKNEKHL